MHEQLSVEFHGHVQGVGFRYNTRDIASRFAVTGTVKNNSDGTVSMVAEGDRQELQAFLGELKSFFQRNISETKENWLPATGHFANFDVIY